MKKRADMAFRERQALRFSVQGFIGVLVCMFEVLEIGFGIPEIECEVDPGAVSVPEKASLPKMRIAAKELGPGALGAIDLLEGVLKTELDFKLPEGYKHRCPIFCPRLAALQNNFKGEGCSADRWQQSDWIKRRKKNFFGEVV